MSHAATDYLGRNPVQAVGSPAEVRYCGVCWPRAAVREGAAA